MTENQSIINELKPFLHEAWNKAGFTTPTDVQTQTIPLIMEGRDVIAESPTGTGKTLAYLLPILNKIDVNKKNAQAMILASSQELVMQIFSVVEKWAAGSGIRSASIIGGANLTRQLEKLKKSSPQIIVGTPGRIYELIKTKKLKMHEVKTVVLDEGDQLLVAEHRGTVQSIVKSTLADRQILLYSATLPSHTEQAANELAKKPEIIKIKKDETIVAVEIEHVYFVSELRDKIKILGKLSRLDSFKGLIFVKDIASLRVAAERLNYDNIPAAMLHSELNKQQRQTNLQQFRDGKSELLLVTDIAARGLDIQGITHVVHYDFPRDREQYIHRSGRTGRFGAAGTVVSIVNEREERDLKKFCKELGSIPVQKDFYKGQIVGKDRK